MQLECLHAGTVHLLPSNCSYTEGDSYLQYQCSVPKTVRQLVPNIHHNFESDRHLFKHNIAHLRFFKAQHRTQLV